jgi:hypothetical protein
MSLKPDLTDNILTPLGIGPGLYFPQSQDDMSLSPEQRWELTRRHPYYLKCWRWARSYHWYKVTEMGPGPGGMNWPLAEACAGVIRGLRVRIDGIHFPDPALGWNEQFGQMREETGASPMTCRELALQLLTRLPDDVRKAVGAAFLQDNALDASFAVNRLREEALDRPHADMVMYWPGVPLEAITSAISTIVKEAAGKQTRRRPEAIKQQLDVWDLREGRTGGSYDGERERRLCDIAREIGAPLSTVTDRYKRAFAHIVGRPFSTELWMVLFLSLKLETSLRKTWRMSRARVQAREGSATDLRSRKKGPGKTHDTPNNAPATEPVNPECDRAISEFNMHLAELLAKGMSISDVAARLKVGFGFDITPEEQNRLIEYITSAPSRLE